MQAASFDKIRALDLLRIGSGLPSAEFREGQEDAIRHVIEGRGRLLIVQRTGWGKSYVYFIACKLLREAGGGPTLLVSPLISLMRNQVASANRMGLHSATMNSENRDQWDEITGALRSNQLDLLLVSPEKLADVQFRQEVLSGVGPSMLVIDEAHCISDWGHDFRPEYRDLKSVVSNLPSNFPFLATTATANDRVVKDLQETLGPNLSISRGDLNRSSLSLQTIHLPRKSERLAWLADRLSEISGNGIIYTLTINDANQVSEWLRSRGIQVEPYTGRTENREYLENALLNNQIKALVATSSLGMGFDKPDLSFVFHYQTPGSAVTYYQQVGRAGRGTISAYGVLLDGEEDTEITDHFIENASPRLQEIQDILNAFNHFPDGVSINQLMANINLSKTRIETACNHMVRDSSPPIVEIRRGFWQLTASTLSEEFWQSIKRRAKVRRLEQQQMQEYASLDTGHMEFLLDALNGDPSSISTPTLETLNIQISPSTLRDAEEFLRRTQFNIPPHKQWPRPDGMALYGFKGGANIKKEHQAAVGKALCLWRNSGWGKLVYQGKHIDKCFSEQLVEASAELVRIWNPQPFPSWVTSVPSSTSPDLVSGFANRLAHALNLPYQDTLKKDPTLVRPQQKEMANNVMQARNVDGSLEICDVLQHTGSVLLVDDMVNSAWTFTVAAWLLRSHGAGDVFPFALATSGKTRYDTTT